jgi:hypothetical protein
MLSRLSLPHSLLVLAAGLASLTSVLGQAGSAAGKTHCSPTMHLFASAASRGSDSLLSISLLSLFSLSLALLSPHYNCRLEPGAAVSGRPYIWRSVMAGEHAHVVPLTVF